MPESVVEVETNPPDLFARFARYPVKTDRVMKKTMEASLLHLQGEIPPYPEGPAGVDTSGRTGTLGRRLGLAQSGGRIGKAEIHTVKRIGSAAYEGKLGTSLFYAPRVIGQQEPPWARYWWTLHSVARKAKDGVIKLHNAAAEELARFIDGIG